MYCCFFEPIDKINVYTLTKRKRSEVLCMTFECGWEFRLKKKILSELEKNGPIFKQLRLSGSFPELLLFVEINSLNVLASVCWISLQFKNIFQMAGWSQFFER